MKTLAKFLTGLALVLTVGTLNAGSGAYVVSDAEVIDYLGRNGYSSAQVEAWWDTDAVCDTFTNDVIVFTDGTIITGHEDF